MTRKSLTTFVASILTAAALTAPALAGGQVSLTYAPTDPDQAQAMQTGMQVFSLFQGLSANGGISQNGFGNMAGIAQNGLGNTGVLVQDGNGHNGTIQQTGNGNGCALIQLGEGTDGECVQTGGQTSTTVQIGF